MKTRKRFVSALLALVLASVACNLPNSQQPTPIDPNQAAAQTLTAIAQNQPLASVTPTTTNVPLIPTSTSLPPSPAPTAVVATFTPSGPFFIVNEGANCRVGPGTNYDKLTSFAPGIYLPLTGRNADNSWWYVSTGSATCWIFGATGRTTGDVNALPVVAAPPTPTGVAGAGPLLGDPIALVAELSYPGNCKSNTLQVAIRVTDAGKGINSVWLSYRYTSDGGYVGSWRTVLPNDNAAGGVNGFNYAIGAEAVTELGTQNGTLQYQFFAKDNSGNITAYPSGSVLGMPIKYCL